MTSLQEIRDSSETAFPNLVNDINAVNNVYDWWTGARQGTTSSKEQVGFIWNRNNFSKVDGYDFDDTATSWFERPPTIIVLERISMNYEQFQTQKLAIISGHLKPVSGVSNMVTEDEINHLQDVYNDLLLKHPDINDVLVVGDFNADCTYVAAPESLTLYTSTANDWLITFDADTTVSSTDCAYDHIVRCGHDIFKPLVPGTFIHHFDPLNEEISFLKKKFFFVTCLTQNFEISPSRENFVK